jgi:hypothetical protein
VRVTTLKDIGPLRLAAQRLVGERAKTPTDAVRRLLAAQAQDLPGALTSIALRTTSRSRTDVAAALDAGEVVRSWPMRGTLHLVAPEDLPWMLDVLGSRTLAGVAKRWANLELDEKQAERARESVLAALTDTDRASRADLLTAIADGGVATTGQRGYHLLWYLSQTGTLCLGPTDGNGDQLYVRLDGWIPEPRRLEPEQAHAELAAATSEADGVVLLPGFDEFVLGYGDRAAVLPAEFAQRIVPGNNGMFRPTVVYRGQVVGTWKWTGRGARRAVDAEPFTAFPKKVATAVPKAAASLP